jgi:tripartite-type tricarboxylate transporter receptor subunit TctC
MYFDNVRNLKPFIQSGKLRALAVTSEARTAELPDVPTMAEAGIKDFVGFYWNGVLAPAGTPAAIVERLNTIITDAVRSKAVQDNLAKLGMEPITGSPKDFADLIAAEHRGWAAVARAANF